MNRIYSSSSPFISLLLEEDELLLNFLQSKSINILLVLSKIDKLKKCEYEHVIFSAKNVLETLDISTTITSLTTSTSSVT